MRRIILIISAAVAMFLMSACCPKTEETFTLWQLPSQVNTIGNSYVIQTVNGKLIVMDGGSEEETEYLRGFISALGAEVEAWFISHPHDDHFWALINILKEPRDIKINNIYHSRITPETIETENGLSCGSAKGSSKETLTTSCRAIFSCLMTSTASAMLDLIPRDFIQSFPEPSGITPRVKSVNVTLWP